MKTSIDQIIVNVEPGQSKVISYQLNGLNHTKLWDCAELDPRILENVILTVSPSTGEMPDLIDNPLSWLICSERLAEPLAKACGDCFQILETNIVSPNGECLNQYKILNVLLELDALDLEHSDYGVDEDDGEIYGVYSWVFKKQALPTRAILFRDKNFRYSVFLSRDVAISLGGFSGFVFCQCGLA